MARIIQKAKILGIGLLASACSQAPHSNRVSESVITKLGNGQKIVESFHGDLSRRTSLTKTRYSAEDKLMSRYDLTRSINNGDTILTETKDTFIYSGNNKPLNIHNSTTYNSNGSQMEQEVSFVHN